MHAGKNYSFTEVLYWTRRDLIFLIIVAAIPTCCYILLDWKWLAIPWLPVALLGTAVAFAVGFRNNASYDRTWEARKSWGGIVNSSRSWGIMVNDYITNKHASNKLSDEDLRKLKLNLVYRHFAWLSALRYQLREPRVWESMHKKHNIEFRDKWFSVSEHKTKLEPTLKKYLSPEELSIIMAKSNKATQLIGLQSAQLKHLHESGYIEDFRHMELEKMLVEFLNQQGVSERIKNFPYPRQYATINLYFIKIFVMLVPLGLLKEFSELGGNMTWLTIPFGALSTWIFTSMEKIGESTESPFEGSANDVPITTISRNIEIDLLEMFNHKDIPPTIQPENNILL